MHLTLPCALGQSVTPLKHSSLKTIAAAQAFTYLLHKEVVENTNILILLSLYYV